MEPPVLAKAGFRGILSRMASPLLFLDIDGVLNSYGSRFESGQTPLDPANIACFNRIVAATGADIVVTSTWRYFTPFEELRGYFAEAGILGEIVDVAPDLIAGLGTEAARLVTRGQEIHAWFKERGELDPCAPEDVFVILDDRTDLEPYLDRLVLTTIERGLTDAEADRAIELLLAPGAGSRPTALP